MSIAILFKIFKDHLIQHEENGIVIKKKKQIRMNNEYFHAQLRESKNLIMLPHCTECDMVEFNMGFGITVQKLLNPPLYFSFQG